MCLLLKELKEFFVCWTFLYDEYNCMTKKIHDRMTNAAFKNMPNILLGWKSELAQFKAIDLKVISLLLVLK